MQLNDSTFGTGITVALLICVSTISQQHFEKHRTPLGNITAVVTDGEPAMIGNTEELQD